MAKRYSWNLSDYVNERLPPEIKQALYETGWNAFGIHELVQEGIKIEKKIKPGNQQGEEAK
ncbi:hypothetical protein LCGC14_1217570 [marine sediment metagenome]|uniref:Uncharacterized protein n=1 Tax=marine sediment metagenome TaxID=412755 RepID=A0A0F9LGA1_9ZZZZ